MNINGVGAIPKDVAASAFLFPFGHK